MKPSHETFRHFSSMVFFIVVSFEPAATLWANALENATQPPAPAIATVQSTYGKLPLSFEANQGQWDPSVQFATRGRNHTLFLTPNEAVLSLSTGTVTDRKRHNALTQPPQLSRPSAHSNSVVRMKFAGADTNAEVSGFAPLPGITNYFIGDDPTKWRTHIPTYRKVEYKNLYAGIDLVYYGNQGQLEYDLVVAPGADPAQIMLAFDGAEHIAVDEQGDLVLTLPQQSRENGHQVAPTLRLHKPVVYQRDEQGEKHLLAGTYAVRSSRQPSHHTASAALHPSETQHIAFQVASYDASKPLIIDPVLSWATYLGGSGGDASSGIALDAAGNIYMTGSTNSPDFPGTASSPIQNTIGVGPSDLDAFVTKLNPAGTAILYSTYLGSSGGDTASGIAVDPAGNAYVTGSLVGGPDFPGTAGSLIQSTMRSDRDAFVTKINTTGTAILYSTFLGSGGDDFAYGIAVDQSGNAYVTGETWESDFPGTAGSSIQNIFGGDIDAFVTKINAAGTAIVYSTYLGGQRSEYGNGIAVDQEGQVYVTGPTASPNFPGTANSPIHNSGSSFVTKLNAAGTAIVYSTYLGSNGGGIGIAIAVDDVGNAYVTGGAGPGFLGTASSPIQNTNGGDTDAYVIKLNRAGTAIVYSTYLGGSGREYGLGIAVDAAGNAYVTGQTDTPGSGFPGTASSPIQSTFGGGQTDAFVTKLNSTGTAILYSTYLGGSRSEFGSGIALDAAGNAYVSGRTSSSDFPSTAGSPLQNMLRGGFDAFVAKISSSIPFAEFDARAKLDVDDRRHHGGFKSHHRPYHDDAEGRDYRRQGDDEFKLEATFTLGGGSNGIEPLKEAMIIQVGTFSTAIPAGSFKQHKGRYVFEGRINGVHLEAVLRSLILGNDYELKVEAHGADLTGTTNPVPVSVTIGDDSGSKEITAKIK